MTKTSTSAPPPPAAIDAIQMKERIVAYARSLGFERVAMTSADPAESDGVRLEDWLAAGFAGEMAYMYRDPARRSHPNQSLPGARTLLALATNYFLSDGRHPAEGRVARYAAGRDYHKVIGKRLAALVRYLESLAPDVRCKTFVDAGPLLERAFARRSGLGFIGKNTLLITRGLGSWVFLASIATTLELPPDAPETRSCGECRLCIDACPTGALTEPYELDARRCISYLTIESIEPIPIAMRGAVSPWVFGCDVCQDVCPHNTRTPVTEDAGFQRTDAFAFSLRDLLELREEKDFETHFAGTPFTRAGRGALVRNACVAAAGLGRRDLLPTLEVVWREDRDAMVREHAAWALGELQKES